MHNVMYLYTPVNAWLSIMLTFTHTSFSCSYYSQTVSLHIPHSSLSNNALTDGCANNFCELILSVKSLTNLGSVTTHLNIHQQCVS